MKFLGRNIRYNRQKFVITKAWSRSISRSDIMNKILSIVNEISDIVNSTNFSPFYWTLDITNFCI